MLLTTCIYFNTAHLISTRQYYDCAEEGKIIINQKINCFQMSNTRRIFTLAMVRRTNYLLLGLKKKGFGEGKWNGFGGKVEKDETVSEGAVR